jgi:hypothetical protein
LLALSAGNVSSRALEEIQIHYLQSTLGLFNTLTSYVILILFITFFQDAKDSTTLIPINNNTRIKGNIKKIAQQFLLIYLLWSA